MVVNYSAAEISLDELKEAAEAYRVKYKKFKAYIEYLETIPESKRTLNEKELVKKYGRKQTNPVF
jgi:hypothetical protein